MRGRVAAVLLLLSSLSPETSGQCGYAPRYSGQFRSTIYDVAVDGSYLWTATGYGVQLRQITSEGAEVVDALALPGSTRSIAVGTGNIAYAGSGSQIFVLRRNGNQIEFVRGVDAPDVINDLEVRGALFAATRSGIAHYHLIDVTNPTRTTVALTTSRPNVVDLEITGTNLYAADGDGSVDIFNISVPTAPQRTGSLESALRVAAVHAGPGATIFLSDDVGQNTEVFGGPASVGRFAYGSLSFAATTSNAVFIAGSDRTVRAIDTTNFNKPIELFEQQLAPTGGSSNSIFELARSGNSLYVAAGDSGLLTYDISSIAPPFPLISYSAAPATSTQILEGSTPRVYLAEISGVISETSIDARFNRGASVGGTPILHDSRGSDLLFSNGKNVSLFAMTFPATFEGSFAAMVTQAVVLGTDTIVALLVDGTVWTLKTTAGAKPEKVDTGTALISSLARNATTYALGEVTEEGQTVIRHGSKKYTIEGAATGGIAISATHAAFFTFRGINLVDLASGAVSVLPDSTHLLPKQLLFAGTDLLVLGERALMVWDTANQTLKREHLLPANAVRMDAGAGRAAIATNEGMVIVEYLEELPSISNEPDLNRYHTKAVAGRDRLYLFGLDGVDVYETAIGSAPHLLTSITEPGFVDVAATQEMFFILGGNGTVSAYSRSGARLAQTLINEGVDTQVLAIATAGDAVWVTISKGCFSGACEKRTLILDPHSLAVTASFAGGATDVTAAGTRAFALLDLPHEIAAFDIANPLVPVMTAHVIAPASAASIAFANDRVLVLGDKLYKYTPALAAAGEHFATSTARDQQIRVGGNCAIVIGRNSNVELYDAGSFAGFSQIALPANAQSIAVTTDGRLYVLTEHSIEVWTIEPPKTPAKRRSAR